MNKLLCIITAIVFLFSYENTWACGCFGKLSVKKAIKKSDLVFIGKVISIENILITQNLSGTKTDLSHYYHKVTLSLEQLYKGKIRTITTEVITGVGGGDCGYEFEMNKSYIVYANKRNRYFKEGDKVNTFMYTHICERTTAKVDEERIEIEKYIKPQK